MYSDNIVIESPFTTVNELLHVEHLLATHQKLNLSKPVVFYFVTDEELLELNRKTLQHDYYTDIITFDYEEDEDIEENEIVISWDRVKENAATYSVSEEHELYRVCFHGLLHLAKFNDKTTIETTEMRKQEEILLKQYCST